MFSFTLCALSVFCVRINSASAETLPSPFSSVKEAVLYEVNSAAGQCQNLFHASVSCLKNITQNLQINANLISVKLSGAENSITNAANAFREIDFNVLASMKKSWGEIGQTLSGVSEQISPAVASAKSVLSGFSRSAPEGVDNFVFSFGKIAAHGVEQTGENVSSTVGNVAGVIADSYSIAFASTVCEYRDVAENFPSILPPDTEPWFGMTLSTIADSYQSAAEMIVGSGYQIKNSIASAFVSGQTNIFAWIDPPEKPVSSISSNPAFINVPEKVPEPSTIPAKITPFVPLPRNIFKPAPVNGTAVVTVTKPKTRETAPVTTPPKTTTIFTPMNVSVKSS